MRHLRIICFLTLLSTLFVSCAGSPGVGSSDGITQKSDIPRGQFKQEKTITTKDGQKYDAVDIEDKNGKKQTIYFDQKGKRVSYDDIEPLMPPPSPYSKELKKLLNREDQQGQPVECILELNDFVSPPKSFEQQGVFDKVTGKFVIYIDGKPATPEQLKNLEDSKKKLLDDYVKAKKDKRKEMLKKLLDNNSELNIENDIKYGYTEEADPLVVTLKIGKIKTFYEKNKDIVRRIIIKPNVSTTSLETAMVATHVKSYLTSANDPKDQGDGVGVYMTEPECSYAIDEQSNAKTSGGYTSLGAVSCNAPHPLNVASIIRTVSPKSHIYCRSGSTLPTDSDLAYHTISLVSASFRFVMSDTGYTYWDKEWDDFIYNKSILAVVAAGNEGDRDGYVTPPSRGLNVLTVGNYYDGSNTINYSSSWKDPSDTHNTKPEISAPGTYIDAGYQYLHVNDFPRKIVMTGTSQATPHVAGILANLIGHYPVLRGRPYLQKAFIIGGAYHPVTGGFDKTGWGGVDIKESFYGGSFWWWEGSNSSFERYAKNDVDKTNDTIDVDYYLSANKKTRIVLTWLNRGEWVYDHLDWAHPIGMDLDFTVIGPGGETIGYANSWDNGFEVYEFTPSTSGNYRIKINRYANRDKNSELRMALDIGTKDYN